MNDLQGQVQRIENCLQLGYAKTKYEIIKDGEQNINLYTEISFAMKLS